MMGAHKTNQIALMAEGRPRCASYPHFVPEKTAPTRTVAHCRAHTPQVFFFPMTDKFGGFQIRTYSDYPPTVAEKWCGEHPDFLRWYHENRGKVESIAALEAQIPEGAA